jgi:hypothetical protein
MNSETNATVNPEVNPHSKRDAKGRYVKGSRGGPGNPFARKTAQLRSAFVQAATQKDMRAMFDSMKARAIEGDVQAFKAVMSYCVGKPAHMENPDTLDQHELQTINANHLGNALDLLNVIKGTPLDIVVELLRVLLPLLRTEKWKMTKEVLCAPLTEEEIERNREDAEDDASDEKEGEAPAFDPIANIPEWMHNIGKEEAAAQDRRKEEAEKAQKEELKKDKKAARPEPSPSAAVPQPSNPAADAELLRVLMERARDLEAMSSPGSGNGKPDTPEPSTNGVFRPSANGKK